MQNYEQSEPEFLLIGYAQEIKKYQKLQNIHYHRYNCCSKKLTAIYYNYC